MMNIIYSNNYAAYAPGNLTGTLRGQVSGISSPAFSQTLKFEDGTTPCYNGNISEMTVAYNGSTSIKRSFSYDRLNRLTSQTSTDGYNTAYSYSLNSSPLTVLRYGMTSDGTVGVVDDLTMSYSGNRLIKTIDSADPVLLENSLDFPVATATYSYDSDGRMIADTSRGITAIRYNPAGRPAAIDTQSGGSMTYSYEVSGRKMAESYQSSSGTATRYYVSTLELVKEPGDASPHVVRANLPWGYLTADGRANAYIPDYQGNIRAVIDPDGTAIQTTDYYPYGLPMATSTGASQNRYKYGAKELETREGLNFHGFEARMLFNDHTLFTRPDDKAAKYPGFNPYLYCAANPLRYVDPSGEVWVERYFDGVREIFYDRNVTNQSDLEGRDYYKNGKFSGVRLLEDGETINLEGNNYTFVNDSQENKYGSVVCNNHLLPSNQIIRGKSFDIFGTSDNSCDAATLHKKLMGTSYTGPKNPYTYEGENYPSYQYIPRNMSEIPAIAHDKAYDRANAKGTFDALSKTTVIEADENFVKANLYVYNHGTTYIDRCRSGAAIFVFSHSIYC